MQEKQTKARKKTDAPPGKQRWGKFKPMAGRKPQEIGGAKESRQKTGSRRENGEIQI